MKPKPFLTVHLLLNHHALSCLSLVINQSPGKASQGVGCCPLCPLVVQHQSVEDGLILLVLLKADKVHHELALLAVPAGCTAASISVPITSADIKSSELNAATTVLACHCIGRHRHGTVATVTACALLSPSCLPASTLSRILNPTEPWNFSGFLHRKHTVVVEPDKHVHQPWVSGGTLHPLA